MTCRIVTLLRTSIRNGIWAGVIKLKFCYWNVRIFLLVRVCKQCVRDVLPPGVMLFVQIVIFLSEGVISGIVCKLYFSDCVIHSNLRHGTHNQIIFCRTKYREDGYQRSKYCSNFSFYEIIY